MGPIVVRLCRLPFELARCCLHQTMKADVQSMLEQRKSRAIFLSALVLTGFTLEARAASCKSYSTCREAVIAWCAGQHPRADGDNDGIPCENVCRSRADVVAIMAEIGCSR